MKTYYKVVNSKLQSCCCNPYFPAEYRVQYKLNEWVKPVIPNTRLFIFGKEDDAFLFQQYMGYMFDVYSCYAKNVACVKQLANPSFVHDFWLKKKQHKKILSYLLLDSIPTGTLSCSEIMLRHHIIRPD